MQANMMKWMNQIYLIICQSFSFWKGLMTKGIVQTLVGLYDDPYSDKILTKSHYQNTLSFVWLLLLGNVLLANSVYLTDYHPIINFLSVWLGLVFIVITVLISWLSFILITLDVSSEQESLLLAFHSAVRFWPSSISFSLCLIIAAILASSNLPLLICVLPGLYCQLSKNLMNRHRELLKATKLQ